jgi:hypothetical protein
MQKGQAAGQATKTVAKGVIQYNVSVSTAKLKATFAVISFGPFVIWTNGAAAFKINNQVHAFLMKALGSAITVGTATAKGLSGIGWNGLKTAGIEGNELLSVAMGEARALKDGFTGLIKEIIKIVQTAGTTILGAFLTTLLYIGKAAIAPYEPLLKAYYQPVAKALGIAWEQAKQFGADALNKLKSYGQQKLKQAANLGKSALNTASNYAGQAVGAAKGFVQSLFEMFERILNFKSDTISGLMVEVRYISRGILL